MWTKTNSDIEAKIKLRLGLEKARSTELYQAVADVVFTALGGKKSKAKPTANVAEGARALGAITGKSVAVEKNEGVFKGLDEIFAKL